MAVKNFWKKFVCPAFARVCQDSSSFRVRALFMIASVISPSVKAIFSPLQVIYDAKMQGCRHEHRTMLSLLVYYLTAELSDFPCNAPINIVGINGVQFIGKSLRFFWKYICHIQKFR